MKQKGPAACLHKKEEELPRKRVTDEEKSVII